MATSKAVQTRARILETALELFRERGFEQTTMRAIAERSGTSLGNAYYYFKSKEHLIQAFYGRSQVHLMEACGPFLEKERDLEKRLAGTLRARIDTMQPYHRFAGVLFRSAADPQSPLHPLSEESQPIRDEATELMAEVLRGSNTKVSKKLEQRLPELLWLYMMGVMLFWIHDSSKEVARTYKLIDHSAVIVVRLIKVASNPLMRPMTRRAFKMLDEIKA